MLPREKPKPDRKAHGIRRKKGTRYPARMIFFDTETKTDKRTGTERFVLAYAVYWEINKVKGTEKIEWFDTTKQKDLYNFIISKCKSHLALRVLSANIWFDARVSGIFDRLWLARWVCTRQFDRGHTLIYLFSDGNHRIEFVNVQNYFNYPVSKIGESIGLPKIKINLDRVSQGNLKRYCKRDTEIIFQAFRSLYYLIKDNKLGSVTYTLPSIAYSCYVHSFLPRTISIHTQADVLDLERKSYFGGRCECFRLGKFTGGPFYKVDVNAMYPFVMKMNEYPVKLDQVGHNLKPELLLKFTNKWMYIAEVELETDQPVYPYRQGGKLIFPVGRFTTTLTTPSLLYAIERGHVKKVRVVAAYFKGDLFTDFVDYFYQKRLEYRAADNLAFAYICKLILNSLYGKFGQKRSKVVDEYRVDSNKHYRRYEINAETKERYIHQVFYGLEQWILQGEEESENSMPAISAHVTDYARLYLWKIIKKAKRSNCYYCDTDSLIVNQRGYKNLKAYFHQDQLGKLKVEDTCQAMEIRGAKNYTFGGKVKIKGIPRGATKLKGQVYRYSHFPNPRSELRDGLKEDYRVEQVTKKLTGIYDKGIVKPNGRVIPYTLPIYVDTTRIRDDDFLLKWIREKGGISEKKARGEAKFFTYKESSYRGLTTRRLDGLSFDQLRGLAVGEGYINEDTTQNEFIEMLKNELRLTRS